MFHAISWGTYWATLGLLLLVYYLVVSFLYIKKARPALFSGLAKSDSSSSIPFARDAIYEATPEPEFSQPAKGSLESSVYACVDDLNAYIQDVKRLKPEQSLFLT